MSTEDTTDVEKSTPNGITQRRRSTTSRVPIKPQAGDGGNVNDGLSSTSAPFYPFQAQD